MLRYAIPLLALTALAAPAWAGEVQIQATGPVVELSVNEIVRSAPDIAQIGAGVQTQAPTARAAVQQNSAAMERIVQRLRSLGIESKDIQTANFNLNPQYRYNNETGEQTFTGYQVSNNVQVMLRDLDRAGEVLDALVQAGANNIYGPNFMLEDDVEAKSVARKNAFERGMRQAQEFARMAGYSGVRLLEVSESFQGYGRVPPPAAAMRVMAEGAADSSVPVEPGEVATGVTLGLKYEMTR